MRLQTAAASLLLASSTQNYSVHGFSNNGSSSSIARGRTNTVESSGRSELKVSAVETTVEGLTASSIKKGLKFRELQGACVSLGLESSGSTARLKARLLEAIGDASVKSTGGVGVMDDVSDKGFLGCVVLFNFLSRISCCSFTINFQCVGGL